MRASMKFVVVCGEVLFFGLVTAVAVRAGEPWSVRPTYVNTNYNATASPYSRTPATRVTMINRDGQVGTLEYRKPVKIVEDYDTGELVPITDLPVFTAPARDADLTPISNVRQVGYPYQANYQPATLPLVQTAHCAQPVVNYPPATQYSAPNYSVPVTGAPQVVYRPVTPVAPVVQSDLQVGTGIYGQPVIYRPGQPVRNAWRWLTP